LKLKSEIPLEDKKRAALQQIDERFAHHMMKSAALSGIYAEKAAIAHQVLHEDLVPPSLFHEEALSKDISIDELCQQILSKKVDEKEYLIGQEALRQKLKANIRTAMSEQEIASTLSLAP